MNQYYFHKLGHCSALGLAEYEELTKEKNYLENKIWLLGEKTINCQKTGSLVFGGKVLTSWKIEDFNIKSFIGFLEKYLANPENQVKKAGFILPKFLKQEQIFSTAKEHGIKKITFSKQEYPTFGNWKQTKNWFILFIFQDKYYFGKIESYSNQEFWADLDFGLINNDIKRGIINLKLARSMMNLTEETKIFDPFCGVGRSLIGGMDLKDEFLASDLDEKCVLELEENYEKAKEIWAKNRLVLSKDEIWIADLKKVFSLNAEYLDKTADFIEKEWFENCAIVTEGYLGKNFSHKPDISEIKKESKYIFEVWQNVLKKANLLKISEIIFCLPFYPHSGFKQGEPLLPDYLFDLIKNSNYTMQKLGKFENIQYSRANSNTGHLIIKLLRKI